MTDAEHRQAVRRALAVYRATLVEYGTTRADGKGTPAEYAEATAAATGLAAAVDAWDREQPGPLNGHRHRIGAKT